MCLSCARLGETCRSGHCNRCVVSRAPSPAHSQESKGVRGVQTTVLCPSANGRRSRRGPHIPSRLWGGHCIFNRPLHMQSAEDTFLHDLEAAIAYATRQGHIPSRPRSVQRTQFTTENLCRPANAVCGYERSLQLRTEFTTTNGVYEASSERSLRLRTFARRSSPFSSCVYVRVTSVTGCIRETYQSQAWEGEGERTCHQLSLTV